MSALLAVLLFSIGALAVDLGNAQARKRATQLAADLAALAGAQALPDVAAARTAALDYLDRNKVAGESYAECPTIAARCYDNDGPDYANGEIIVRDKNGANLAPGSTAGYQIRVIVARRTVTFGLAGIMGFSSSTVHAAATVGFGSPKGQILPFGVAAAGGAGLYCIHNNSPGQNSVMRAALLSGEPLTLTPNNGGPGGGYSVVLRTTTAGTFNNGSTVFVDGVAVPNANTTHNSATQITIRMPASLGSPDVNVYVRTGSPANVTSVASFHYYPAVTSISPATGPAGTQVTINGTGFASSATVRFGGTSAASVSFVSANQLTATAPAGSGSVDVVVTVAGSSSATSGADIFTYGSPPPPPSSPTVTSVSPNSGLPGVTVTVTGTGFTPGTVTVAFGSNAATGVTVTSSTQLTAVAPTGTGAVDVIVTVNGTPSAISAADQFTYIVDACAGSTGNFGYLDLKGWPNPNALEQNIIKGARYVPSIFPSAQQPPVNSDCGSYNNSIPGAILDNGTNNKYNCVDVQNGNTVSSATQALLDGVSNPRLDARLHNPPVPPCQMGTVKGRANIENDSLAAFLNEPLSTFVNNINTPRPGVTPVKKEIYECPRFFLVPKINITGNQQNGFYPIVGFMGCWIEDFETNNGGRQVTAIKAYVFSLDLIENPGGSNGTIDYLGSGARVPVLVHDAYDLPY